MAKFNIGQPFIVAADPRTGGTFLCHCLSSHPEVYCHRAEVLHGRDIPREFFPKASGLTLVRLFIEQQGWKACGVKLTYKETTDRILEWLGREKGKLFFLRRENAIRVAVSRAMTSAGRHGVKLNYPVWRFTPGQPTGKLNVDPLAIIREARLYAAGVQQMTDRLSELAGPLGIGVLPLTYVEMVGAEGKGVTAMRKETADKVCQFLGVEPRRLTTRMTKGGTRYLRDIVANWKQLRDRIVNSELAYCLKDEGPDDGKGELERDRGSEPDTEPGVGEPDHTEGREPRPDGAPTGDQPVLGPE